MALSYQTSAFEVARAYLLSTITLTALFIYYAPDCTTFFFQQKSERSELHFIDLNLSSDVIIEKDKRGEYFIVYSQDIIDSIDA